MAALLKYCYDMHNYLFIELADKEISNYMLMGSPLPMMLIIGIYYYFIFYGGRKLMENHKPFKLNNIMAAFNIVQIIANMFLVVKIFPIMFNIYKNNMFCLSFENIPNSDKHQVLSQLRYWRYFYVMLKLSDLFDTVFMVLKKNYHQITFLHVYHHVGMCIGTWLIVKLTSSNHEAFTAGINAIIHVTMYTYYLLSLYNKNVKSLGWKKFITQLQLIQFILIFYHHVVTILDPNCSVPKLPILIYMTQVALMIVLFSQFYFQAYIKTKKLNKQDYKQH
ncbi:elongation of very long chain fatty acids protein 7-like [Cimex lectularius]|uniref:Elongation of very long chain fatty acids protein n=1 Tax=Cimex lectularius TaxID=79782 RepID=A0A8I6RJG5_CIMLE|nr:elongation of very long chain fatty acids protein 7-like [Cimex lectularius]XP_014247360.1 elongation of very long chain fatty acids protein 7-like [Cimex lectularius]